MAAAKAQKPHEVFLPPSEPSGGPSEAGAAGSGASRPPAVVVADLESWPDYASRNKIPRHKGCSSSATVHNSSALSIRSVIHM